MVKIAKELQYQPAALYEYNISKDLVHANVARVLQWFVLRTRSHLRARSYLIHFVVVSDDETLP